MWYFFYVATKYYLNVGFGLLVCLILKIILKALKCRENVYSFFIPSPGSVKKIMAIEVKSRKSTALIGTL